MTLSQVIFYSFAALMVLSATMVILSRNPVRSALFLVLAFFASAAVWLFLEAEFLALVLIIVYVGAVMTLFLFVVMMLNIDLAPLQEGFVKYLPFGLFFLSIVLGLMLVVIGGKYFNLEQFPIPGEAPAGFSNIKSLGAVLYTDYVFVFEVAGVLLLVAIMAAIALTLRGPQNRLGQSVPDQVKTRPQDRLRVVSMQAETRVDKE